MLFSCWIFLRLSCLEIWNTTGISFLFQTSGLCVVEFCDMMEGDCMMKSSKLDEDSDHDSLKENRPPNYQQTKKSKQVCIWLPGLSPGINLLGRALRWNNNTIVWWRVESRKIGSGTAFLAILFGALASHIMFWSCTRSMLFIMDVVCQIFFIFQVFQWGRISTCWGTIIYDFMCTQNRLLYQIYCSSTKIHIYVWVKTKASAIVIPQHLCIAAC